MARLEIALPAMGEGIIEATLTRIFVEKGQKVEEDTPLFEVATDKVDTEIAAPEGGIVEEFFYAENDVIPVGKVVAVLQTDSPEAPPSKPEYVKHEQAPVLQPQAQETEKKHGTKLPARTSSGKFLSPLVRQTAQKENLSLAELEEIQGTGLGGRLTQRDVLSFLSQKSNAPKENQPTERQATAPLGDSPETSEIIEMDRMRRLIAGHMLESKRVSPHVTSFAEADVSAIVWWREKNKETFLQQHGEKLTYTPFFVRAVVKALGDFPRINSSVEGKKWIVKKPLNIGIAAALPSGNLIVPVIKNAENLSLTGLAKAVNGLAKRARQNKLAPAEIQGGTFTITNVGTFGNISGTAIINQPEVAILAVGSITKKPAVIETPQGDTLGIRHKVVLSLSYDHRVVDGALGGSFLSRIAFYLQNMKPDEEI